MARGSGADGVDGDLKRAVGAVLDYVERDASVSSRKRREGKGREGSNAQPIGIDMPDDNSRCTCDSVVRAPIAPHETKSAMY